MFCIVLLDVRDSKSEIEIEMLEILLNAKDAERCCERQRQSQKWSEGERERVWVDATTFFCPAATIAILAARCATAADVGVQPKRRFWFWF